MTPQVKQARDLNDPKYTINLDSQDIYAIAEHSGIDMHEYGHEFTGAIVEIGDGDYNEIWLTSSRKPYDLDAVYHSPDFWMC